jgi:hypothetical protein
MEQGKNPLAEEGDAFLDTSIEGCAKTENRQPVLN